MRKTPLLLVLALGGCTASYSPPELPASHPASLEAEAAPPLERSRTLDVPEPAQPAPVQEQPTAPHEHHHGGAPMSPSDGSERGPVVHDAMPRSGAICP